jgi:glycosyltransferase involved in cell wall biosynthesis
MDAADRVLASDWYAMVLGDRCASFDSALRSRFGARLAAAAERLPPLRGLLLHRLGGSYRLLAMVRSERGAATLLALDALRRGPARIVILELIGPGRPRSAAGRLRLRLRSMLEGAVIRRAMAAGQVLTEWEREAYSRRLRLPPGRLRVIRWPLVREATSLPRPQPAGARRVVSSGRAYCDWETLFAAARGRDWDLLAICGRRDLDRVRRLAAAVGAEVRCEVSRSEHDLALAESNVYALCLQARAVSAGQVRLAAAVGAGVPVVASRVDAIEGYASEETALLVPPADPEALGAAVDRLLDDPAAARALREAAHRAASHWTYNEYFAALGDLLDDAATTSAASVPRRTL